MTHTPGPWSVSKHGTPDYAPQYGIYSDGSGNDHAIVKGEAAEADARLIAAAPDLLATLRGILAYVEDGNVVELRPCGFIKEVAEAIAQAEGR